MAKKRKAELWKRVPMWGNGKFFEYFRFLAVPFGESGKFKIYSHVSARKARKADDDKVLYNPHAGKWYIATETEPVDIFNVKCGFEVKEAE